MGRKNSPNAEFGPHRYRRLPFSEKRHCGTSYRSRIMKQARILFVVDVRGWAYDDAALHWQAQFSAEFDIEIIYLSDYRPNKLSHYGIALFQQAISGESPSAIMPDQKHILTDAPPVFDHKR